MHETLNRYFGDVLTEEIISKDGIIEGETKWVTICFTDISSYSTIVEYMSPSVAVKFLNEYFSKMHEVIDKHKGQILNYIGDSIMIVFGAPNNLENHEKIAVECALEMRKFFKQHGIEFAHVGNTAHVPKKEIRCHKLWPKFVKGALLPLKQIKDFSDGI